MNGFAQMHNDYLDPEEHYVKHDGYWNLFRLARGQQVFLGRFDHEDGQNVMGCDMHEWMVDCGHYDPKDDDHYQWDGDSSYVAIMSKTPEKPDFAFVWVDRAGSVD